MKQLWEDFIYACIGTVVFTVLMLISLLGGCQ
jgi:hypothetical protein